MRRFLQRRRKQNNHYNGNGEFLHGYPPKREPFLSSEDVEDKEYDYQVESEELEKEIDYEKQTEDAKEEKVESINEIVVQ